MMALQVTFILICAGLTGVQSISTVRHVAVEVGSTVHIPCQYQKDYTNNVKYLCRGNTWSSCTYKIKTNQGNSAKYSINDDKIQRIVTFTIKNLQFSDSDHYWCAVETTGTDAGEQFQLLVTEKGKSKLHVDSQWITGYFGEQVNIYCNYSGRGSIEWCRIGGTCISTSERIDGALVSFDRRVPGLFAVTMTGLWHRNIGWYWCSFRDLQMPVFLNLTVRPTTTTTITTTTESSCASSANEHEKKRRESDAIIAAVVTLGLLTFIVVVSYVVWLRLKRDMKKTEAELLFPEQSADVPVYGNISKGLTSHQNPCADKETEILYSSVTFVNNPASEKVKAKEEDVVYSTLAQH